MWRAVQAGLAAMTGVVLVSCASPGVAKTSVFVTRDRTVVMMGPALSAGETILHVENDDGVAHTVVLARLTSASVLPTTSKGVVPTGGGAQQSYHGAGYQVVAKSERMQAYFNGPNRVRAEFHLYLHPRRYVIFCNAPGDYTRGEYKTFTVKA